MPKGVLVDLSKCVGCRACQIACKEWNELPAEPTTFEGSYENPPELKWNTYTRVRFVEGENKGKNFWRFIKIQCRHCKEPACVSVCPVGAMHKAKDGSVIYDEDECIGCRYCMLACPFGVPTYEWHKALPSIKKCVFCFDRTSDGRLPACVQACSSGALKYGELSEMLEEAKKRIDTYPEKYVNYIYGKDEVGGTSWIYISNVPFKKLGFDMNLPKEPLPKLTWQALSKMPYLVGGLAIGLAGLYFICRRREEVSSDVAKKIKKEE